MIIYFTILFINLSEMYKILTLKNKIYILVCIFISLEKMRENQYEERLNRIRTKYGHKK